jgi:hypothetical protein
LSQNNQLLPPSKNRNIYQVPKTLGNTWVTLHVLEMGGSRAWSLGHALAEPNQPRQRHMARRVSDIRVHASEEA